MPLERILALCHRTPHHYQPKELAVVGQLMQRTPSTVEVNGLKPLAVLADERLEDMPDVPTLKEQGKDLSFSIWFGLFAPKGTSEDKLEKLDAACGAAVEDPAFLQDMEKAQSIVRYKSRSEFMEYYRDQYNSNKDLLELIGIKAN